MRILTGDHLNQVQSLQLISSIFLKSELNVFPLKDEISVNIAVEPIIFWMGYRHNESIKKTNLKADFCCDILTNLKWILKKS